jgi:hypothetical protein
MFIKNSKTEEYFKIVNEYKKAQTSITKKSQLNGYHERHHIIPKSLGGNNLKDNIVFLSPQDHFKCHKLLLEMVEADEHKGKMWSAVWRMMNKQSRNQFREFTFTEEEYAMAKLKNSEEHSKRMMGDRNPFKGKKHSSETLEKMSLSKKGKTWDEIYGPEVAALKKIKTSIASSKLHGPQEIIQCEHCGKTGGIGGMKRWHGDQCKSKLNRIE